MGKPPVVARFKPPPAVVSLYCGLADNSVGCVIDTVLRARRNGTRVLGGDRVLRCARY
jgi:hypothetical protein